MYKKKSFEFGWSMMVYVFVITRLVKFGLRNCMIWLYDYGCVSNVIIMIGLDLDSLMFELNKRG